MQSQVLAWRVHRLIWVMRLVRPCRACWRHRCLRVLGLSYTPLLPHPPHLSFRPSISRLRRYLCLVGKGAARICGLGAFDILIGINLLREGLDIPECALVAIVDADKEGFLRSETSLVQTFGRVVRNVDGCEIMYADKITGSMERSIVETNRRREM